MWPTTPVHLPSIHPHLFTCHSNLLRHLLLSPSLCPPPNPTPSTLVIGIASTFCLSLRLFLFFSFLFSLSTHSPSGRAGNIKSSRRSSYLLAITTERSKSCDEGLNTFREEVLTWVMQQLAVCGTTLILYIVSYMCRHFDSFYCCCSQESEELLTRQGEFFHSGLNTFTLKETFFPFSLETERGT